MLFLNDGDSLGYVALFLLLIPLSMMDFLIDGIKILRKKDIRYVSHYYTVSFDCEMNIPNYQQISLQILNFNKKIKAHITRVDNRYMLFFKPPKNASIDLRKQQFSLEIKSIKHGFYTFVNSAHSYLELDAPQLESLKTSCFAYKTGFELPILTFIVDFF